MQCAFMDFESFHDFSQKLSGINDNSNYFIDYIDIGFAGLLMIGLIKLKVFCYKTYKSSNISKKRKLTLGF